MHTGTIGQPCIPQFPSTGGFPQCGTGSNSLPGCQQICKAPPPPAPPLPSCPAFPDDDDPAACNCETFPPPLGCRGETPRFNWILGLCDAPNSTNATENTMFPGPPGSFSCSNPQRLQPEHANASEVDLLYIASYQWGNPCDLALARVCGARAVRTNSSRCAHCAGSHADTLKAAGCSADALAAACDPCGVALRAEIRSGAAAECGRHDPERCEVCMDIAQPEVGHEAACAGQDVGERLRSYCQREKRWVQVAESSFNVDAANASLDLEVVRQAGGALSLLLHFFSRCRRSSSNPPRSRSTAS